MAPLFPRHDAFALCFSSPLTPAPKQSSPPPAPDRLTRWQARPELYGAAYSTVDDVKGKAQKIGAEATREFEKASAKAQAKAGTIELYSGKYYAACTFGGMLACVRFFPLNMPIFLTID
jgi:solute carrier family 25 phosphate transporter 3